MSKENYVSLVGNADSLQLLAKSTWAINEMKSIQYFDGYLSNTYLVDSKNSQNANLLTQIAKSDIFGCYFDVRINEGKTKINQLVVACSQGIVIFNSIERESNEVMKNFFATISKKQCYARGITTYYKFLNLFSLNIDKMTNVDTNENYSDFIEFRKQSSFSSFSENYRSQSKMQSSNINFVLDCYVNAFEAACIDFYFTNIKNSNNNSGITLQFSADIRNQPSLPPGMNIPPNFDYPPGLGPQPRQRHSMEPQVSLQLPTNEVPKKKEENVTFGPISADILKSNEKKQTEINKRFWKNLDTLIAILSSTKKIETDNGKYFCKTCNENFVSYEYLLEHCWNEHKSALE